MAIVHQPSPVSQLASKPPLCKICRKLAIRAVNDGLPFPPPRPASVVVAGVGHHAETAGILYRLPPKYLCRTHHRSAVEYARKHGVELICRPLPLPEPAGVPVEATAEGGSAVEVGAAQHGG